MPKVLTVKAIDALKPAPRGCRYNVADAIVPGFGVRVTDKGSKSYVVTSRFPGSQNPTRRTIGKVGSIELADARTVARDWLGMLLRGVDPSLNVIADPDVEVKNPQTFEDIATQFLKLHVCRNKLRSAGEIERLINREMMPKWRTREFVSIRRADVAKLLDDIEERAPVLADYVLAVISKICNWYMARNDDYVSPIVRGMRRTKPRQRARDRVLNDEEIRIFWEASSQCGTFGAFLQICLLTSQRKTKVRLLRWDDIDDNGLWSIPSEAREKTNANSLLLPPKALQIIHAQHKVFDNPFVFAGRGGVAINGTGKSKRQIDKLMQKINGAEIKNWTVHDLRRTAKSLMARAGVRPEVSERVLGHVMEGVEGIYDRYSYDAEKAEALDSLAGIVAKLTDAPLVSSELKDCAGQPAKLPIKFAA